MEEYVGLDVSMEETSVWMMAIAVMEIRYLRGQMGKYPRNNRLRPRFTRKG